MISVKKNNIKNIVNDMPCHSSLLTFDIHNYCPVNINIVYANFDHTILTELVMSVNTLAQNIHATSPFPSFIPLILKECR